MQGQSAFSAPDPFHYQPVPLYPGQPFHHQQSPLYGGDLKVCPQGDVAGPLSPWNRHGNGVQFSHSLSIGMGPATVTAGSHGETPTLQPCASQTSSQAGLVRQPWHVSSNMQSTPAYPEGGNILQLPPWQSAAAPCVDVADPSQTTTPFDLYTRKGHFIPEFLPGSYHPCNAFNIGEFPRYYNREPTCVYNHLAAGNLDTLVATSPTDMFSSNQLLWADATPPVMQMFGSDSTCASNQEYSLTRGSLKGIDAYHESSLPGSSKMPCRSVSRASNDTVTASFDSGATPFALVAPLPDMESCLFREVTPTFVKTEDSVGVQVALPVPTVRACNAQAVCHEREERKHLPQKRMHDETIPPAQPPPALQCKRTKKDMSSESANAPFQTTGAFDPPVKRRPGRPLSTSTHARSLVRQLATLHLSGVRDENGGSIDSIASAFEPTLPTFPEVSAYVDGVYNDIENRRSSDGAKQECVPGNNAETAGGTPGRANKVAAKKHREIIKDRMKALEDLNAWLDKAVVEYERCNRRLLDTVGRLRRENEALLPQK